MTDKSSEHSPSTVPPTTELLVALAALVVAGGVLWWIYGRAVHAPFFFDDLESIVRNPSIVRLAPLLSDANRPAPLNPPRNNPTAGRPLVNLSFALNYRAGGLEPTGYRIVNVSLHTVNAMLLAMIVLHVLRLPRLTGSFPAIAAPLVAILAALVWAVHPLNTEAVAYVTQRTELLVAFFYLLVIFSSLRYFAAQSQTQRQVPTGWLIAATLACCLGMACKEMMVTAPAIVLLLDRTLVSESFARAVRRHWPLYAALLLGWLAFAWLNRDWPRGGSVGAQRGVALTDWWLTQSKVLAQYAKLTVWPWPLTIHYPLVYLKSFAQAWPWMLGAALAAAIGMLLLWRRRAAGFVLASIFIILSPTLVVPIVTEVMAERRMYLPLAAVVPLIVAGAYAMLRRVFAPAGSRGAAIAMLLIFAGVSGAVTAALAATSARRMDAYRDPIAIWRAAIAVHPDDYIPHYNLAKALSSAGRTADAIAEYRESIRVNPDDANSHYNLANLLAKGGRPSEALEPYRRALDLKPDFTDARNNLGNTLRALGRLDEAVEQYQQVIQRNPNYLPAYRNLFEIYADQHQREQAIATATRAIEIAASTGQARTAQELRDWLAAYQSETPAVSE